MISLLRLIIIPHKKLFVLTLALLIWITAWFTFLSQSLFSITNYLDIQTVESLWGDVVIESAKPLSAEKRQQVEQMFWAKFTHSSTVRFLNSLTVWTGQPLLTTILGYDDTYPLYGTLETTTKIPDGVYISESLADLLTGSTITVGEATFPIAGEILKMPTAGLNVFDGWRFVLLPLAFVEDTKLIQTGSRVTYRDSYVFDKMPSEQTIDAIQAFIPEQEVENITSERAQREQFFTQLTSVVILALCALVILTYSGLRIVNDMLVRRLLDTMRLIRILGTTKRRLILAALLVLVISLLVAFILWGALWYNARTILPRQDFAFTPQRDRRPYLSACLVTTGIMGALLFSRQELFDERNLLATSVYQNTTTTKQQLMSRWIIALVLLFALLTELGRTRTSFTLGGSIVGGIVLLYRTMYGLLHLFAKKTNTRKHNQQARWWVIRRSSQPWSPMPLMVTLMTSIFALSWVCFLFWHSIMSYIDTFQQTQQANTFILNLREDDRPLLEEIFPANNLFDVILWRISTIDGKQLSEVIAEKQLRAWSYTREFNMTTSPQDDTIVAWIPAGIPLQDNEISVDSRVAEALGIRIGSEIVMSIIGREFTFTVVQLRRTTRNAIKPFFFFQLPAQQFATAPKSYFSLHSIVPQERPAILKRISERVGNHLSYIEVDEIIAQVEELLAAIAWAIILVLSSVILCGAVLLRLCFRNIWREHAHDMRLLQLLWVSELFITKSSLLVLLYPLLVASWLSLGIICLVTSLLRSFQDALPFWWMSILITLLCILMISFVIAALLCYFLKNKTK